MLCSSRLLSTCFAYIARSGTVPLARLTMASVEMVRPRSGARSGTSTSEPGYALLDHEPSRASNATPSTHEAWARALDLIDAALPAPPRPGNPADRRRVWRWALVSAIMCAFMFILLASNGARSRTPNGMREESWSGSLPPPPTTPGEQALAAARLGGASERDAVVTPDSSSIRKEGAAPSSVSCSPLLETPVELPSAPAPTPRPKMSMEWATFESALRRDAATSDARLVLIGDSITEALRGTGMGRHREEYAAGPGVLANRLGTYDPLALAVSGDTTANLLFRIFNSGFPPTDRAPEYVTMMIGTNDLSGARIAAVHDAPGRDADATLDCDAMSARTLKSAAAALAGARKVIEAVRIRAPQAKIVVLGLTPRGDSRGRSMSSYPLRIDYMQPSSWSAAIAAFNDGLRRFVEGDRKRGTGGTIVFQPCEEPFLIGSGSKEGSLRWIDATLMKDGLHPSGAAGLEALVGCVEAGIHAADVERDRETGAVSAAQRNI